MPDPIVIVPYDPAWPAEFERLRQALTDCLGGLVLAIEHIGSTSVPGLAAKPILDINMVMESCADLPAIVERLASLGYEHEGDLGIPGREAFRQPPESGYMTCHLYCSPRDSVALLRHLAFRDYLRAHPEASADYARLKQELAQCYRNDRAAYTDAKTAFVEGILAQCGESLSTDKA